MQTEFEISIRLVCWGDNLDPTKLATAFGLEPSFYDAKFKGEVQKQGDRNHKMSLVKTGRLIMYPHDKQPPRGRRNPDEQFEFVTNKLKDIEGDLTSDFGVEQSELQISLYYENVVPGGDVDFSVPDLLLSELCKHKIRMTITALP